MKGEGLGSFVMPRAASDLLAVEADDVPVAHPVVVDSHEGAHHDWKQDEEGEEGRHDIQRSRELSGQERPESGRK